MRSTSIVAAFLAAGVFAAPVKRDEVVETFEVNEVDYVDTAGNLLSKVFETHTVFTTIVGTQSAAPVEPTVDAQSGSFQQASHYNPGPVLPSSSAPVASVPPKITPSPSPSPSPSATPSASPVASPASNGGAAVMGVVPAAGALETGWIDSSSQAAINMWLYHHNVHRANHSVPAVTWDTDMAAAALTWAQSCVGDEVVPSGSGWGMNIGFSSSDDFNPSDVASGEWYDSELMNFPAYGEANLPVGEGTNFGNWGHFTQVVWPTTTKIGCAMNQCNCKGSWTATAGCFYSPAGNIIGEFNVVKEPQGGPMVYPNGQTSM